MPTFGLALNLKDDPRVIAEYVKHHRNVWPEVLAGIRRAGATEIKIFRNGRHLFMLMSGRDGFDPATAFADYQHDPVVQRWEALMQTLQEQLPGSPPGQWWTQLEKIFDLSEQ